jgi:hypothetical protein
VLPQLYDHLEDLGVDLPAITFGWFLSLFTDALPIQTLLRVWDVLLVYGPISLFKYVNCIPFPPKQASDTNLIRRIAIAIFKIHSAEIFATDSASNFYVLLTNLTSHLYSSDKLLKVNLTLPHIAPLNADHIFVTFTLDRFRRLEVHQTTRR